MGQGLANVPSDIEPNPKSLHPNLKRAAGSRNVSTWTKKNLSQRYA